jgi:D-methionine transport system substrate-binding protein
LIKIICKIAENASLTRRTVLRGAGVLSLLAASGIIPSAQSFAADKFLRVGIMSGEGEGVWHVVSAKAAIYGLTIKMTTFENFTQPNEALYEHDLDANSFQHKPYLEAQM